MDALPDRTGRKSRSRRGEEVIKRLLLLNLVLLIGACASNPFNIENAVYCSVAKDKAVVSGSQVGSIWGGVAQIRKEDSAVICAQTQSASSVGK